MATQRYTQQQVADALTASRGLVTHAALRLTCAPHTVHAYVTRYPKVRAARDAARERVLDVAEDRLFGAVDAGEPWAVQFLLTRLGKARGYGDTLAIDATVGVLHDPQWLRLRGTLVDVLRSYPDAMNAVVTRLRALEAPQDAQPDGASG